MDVLLKSLTQHSAEVMLVLLVAVVALLFLLVRLSIRQGRDHAKWRELLRGATGESLETLLLGQLRDRVKIEQSIAELQGRVTRLDQSLAVSKRHLGLVRYDAFDDVGGNQSFALAVYDDAGNGAVMTSIIGRAECRVYCKPLVNGRSERDLSQEEQRAIREAKAAGPKPILSPE
jgi:hypothetical protein